MSNNIIMIIIIKQKKSGLSAAEDPSKCPQLFSFDEPFDTVLLTQIYKEMTIRFEHVSLLDG